MTKLYEIANEYAQLLNEDLPPELLADTIEAFEGEYTDKVKNLLALIKNEQMMVDALKAESKNLKDRASAIESKIESIKQYIIESMNTLDKKKLTAGIHTLTVRAPSMSVQIDDVDKLPSEFVQYITEVKPDKNLIKEKLKLGQSIDGACLVTGKQSLLIK